MERECELPVESLVYVHIDDELVVGPMNQNADIGIDADNNFLVNGIPRVISDYIMFQVDEKADVQDALQIGLIAGVLVMTTPVNVNIEVIPEIISAEHPREVLKRVKAAHGEAGDFEGYAEL